MMIAPSIISIIIGIALIFTIYSNPSSDDVSGLESFVNTLFLGGLFFLSTIITLTYLIIGSVRLRKLRSK